MSVFTDALTKWSNPQEKMVLKLDELGIERESADTLEIYLSYNKDGRSGRGFYLHMQPTDRSQSGFVQCLPFNGARMFVHGVGRVSLKGWKDARALVDEDTLDYMLENTQ